MHSKRMAGFVVCAVGLMFGGLSNEAAFAADARPSSIECPAGSTKIVNPNPNPLTFPGGTSLPSESTGRTNTFFAVGSGTFTVVSYLSWDGYVGRSGTTQLNEQWAVEIVGSSSIRTSLTTDVPDLVEQASTTGSMASIETTGGFVHFIHSSLYPGFVTDGTFNSVHPIGICFTLTDPVVTTTTTTTTTTSPPVTTATTVPVTVSTVPAETTIAAQTTTTVATTTSTSVAATTSQAPTTLRLLVPVQPTTTLAPPIPTTVAPASPGAQRVVVEPASVAATVATTTIPRVEVLGESVAVAVEGDLAVTGSHNSELLLMGAFLVIAGALLVASCGYKSQR